MYRSKMNSASKGNRPVASRVDSRKSTNIAAIWSSRPPATAASKRSALEAEPVPVETSGSTAISAFGLSWHARRTDGGAPIRFSVTRSTGLGAARRRALSTMRTLQVEQRPRPPHTDACGIPVQRLAFQHGEAGWDGNDTMSGIGDAHRAKALGVPIARRTQAEHYDHQTEIGDGHAVGDPDH